MKRSFALLAVAGFWIACSGKVVTVETAPNDFATAACDKLNSCAPTVVSLAFGDVATCKTRGAISTQLSLKAPGVSVTSAELSACLSAFESASCTDVLSSSSSASKACAFKGTLADGAACGSGFQCKSGSCRFLFLDAPGAAACGTCKATVALDGDCAAANCEPGLYCDGSKCKAFGKGGESCDGSKTLCGSGTACVNGKCSFPLLENGDCTASRGACDVMSGLTCAPNADLVTYKCTKLTLASLNQDCGVVSGKYVSCTGGTYCAGATATTAGKCKATPKEPDDCSESNTCLTPAACNMVTKKCEVFDPASCK